MKNSKLILYSLLSFMLFLTTCKEIKKEMLVTTGAVSNILITTADASGTVLDLGGGATQHGHCYATTPNANVSGTKTELSTPPLGGFTSALTGLSPGTKYYIKAYLSRGKDVVYGDEITFTTASDQLPVVTTADISGITKTGAVSGGDVTDEGGTPVTARGVCWSTATNPTVGGDKTTNGSGTGSFTSNISNLTAGTKYYVKAYATNSGGTAYGNELSFTTTPDAPTLPTVVTAAVTSVTVNSAVCGGDVTNEGGAAVTARGVCWSTSINPDIDGNKTIDGDGQGTFISNLAGLAGNTTYYIRSYAINSVGTAYGNELSFTTGAVLPSITTTAVTAITSTSATSGGDISSDGGSGVTARGICWGTIQNPTISGNHSDDGIGVDNFISNMSGLTPGTLYYVRAYATNNVETAYGNEYSFTTSVVVPTLTTIEISSVTSTTASSGGNITSDGGSTITARGVCWSTSQDPTTADSRTNDGLGSGAFTSTLTGLTGYTTYYVRAYATNSAGTEYGNELSFTTGAVIPTLTTTSVTDITITTATSGGNISDDGGSSVTERGVCWSTSANPITANSKTSDGTGTGSFTSSLTGLTPGTTYHVRAYAKNSVGTGYGEDVTFNTEPAIPSVTTSGVTNITSTTATSGGNVTSDGGATVTARGVCWSTVANPTTADLKTSDGIGTGSFTSNITGLTPGTYYHVRAYAINSVGTAYGEDMAFTAGTVMATVTTTSVTDITSTTATSGGNVTYDRGRVVTARGVCWSKFINPTTVDSKTNDGGGTGNFSSYLTSLAPNTTYYVRAYAINNSGTAYGGQVDFKTDPATVSDSDGNTYDIIRIGTQLWLKQNLRTTKYRNGDPIPNVTDNTQWANLNTGSYCWYENYYSGYNSYGALYNWYAVYDARNLCPVGWHVPTYDEWVVLADFLGGPYDAGGKLKEAGTTHWAIPNTGATNESGFTALPSGLRSYDGTFATIGTFGGWWTSTSVSTNNAWRRGVSNNSIIVYLDLNDKRGGLSVRCIKD